MKLLTFIFALALASEAKSQTTQVLAGTTILNHGHHVSFGGDPNGITMCGFGDTRIKTTKAKCEILINGEIDKEEAKRIERARPCPNGKEKDPDDGQCIVSFRAILNVRIKAYCSHATSLYCTDYKNRLMEIAQTCDEARIYTRSIINQRNAGMPPRITLSNMLSSTVGATILSANDFANMTKEVYSTSKSEEPGAISARIYRECVANQKLP